MWIWSSSCESCSTQSNSISSTLATAAMSPGTAWSISTFFAPCSRNRWPTLNGLRPSPTKSWVSRVTVPWCTRNTPSLPTNGSTTTLKTCASTCWRGSGSERNSTASAPTPLVNSGGLPSVGFGASLTSTSTSSATPAPVLADTKQIGTRWPSRNAFSNGACSCSGVISSPCSRYFAISASSTSMTWSTSALCAWATEEKSASPDGVKKQSTTRLPPPAGRLIGRHSLPNAACRSETSCGRSTLSASILLTMIRRHSLRFAAQSIIRDVIISMPACALTTTAAVSTASSAPMAWPMKSGKPGVSTRWTRCLRGVEMEYRRSQRVLPGLLERIEVACRRPALDAPRRGDRSGLGEQGLGERGLARRAVADERNGSNVLRGVLRHVFLPGGVQAEFTVRDEGPPAQDGVTRTGVAPRQTSFIRWDPADAGLSTRGRTQRPRGAASADRDASAACVGSARLTERAVKARRAAARVADDARRAVLGAAGTARSASVRPRSRAFRAGGAAAPLPGTACRGRGRRRAPARGCGAFPRCAT